MSKISLPIAELKPALTGVGKVISKRPGYIGREVQYGFKLSF